MCLISRIQKKAVEVAKKSFGRVEMFRFSEIVATNHNDRYSEIKNSLNSGSVW
jgi:hypothetical protein